MKSEKYTKPDVLIELTADQIAQIEPLFAKRSSLDGGGGLILGSVGINCKVVALKYVERTVGIEIHELAYQKIEKTEEENDASK